MTDTERIEVLTEIARLHIRETDLAATIGAHISDHWKSPARVQFLLHGIADDLVRMGAEVGPWYADGQQRNITLRMTVDGVAVEIFSFEVRKVGA
jgi:hypothetical protein